jgi:hypothetical protein
LVAGVGVDGIGDAEADANEERKAKEKTQE